MKNEQLQALDTFSSEKLVKDSGQPELGRRTSPLLVAPEHLPPEKLAMLARIIANKSQPFLDEVLPFGQDFLIQFRQMHRQRSCLTETEK